jgi:hypothetical protein
MSLNPWAYYAGAKFLQYSPEGHPFLNGPYAGLFYSKDTKKPFLGLAFKASPLFKYALSE